MNRRRQAEQGIALITTLIMLSVVTLMAVAFLSVSRRERAAVTTSSDRLDAKAMAESAAQRAEAEIVSRVLATTNLFEYDLLVSTNYFNPGGFVPGNTNIANVSFFYANGSQVEGDDLLQLYRNLQVDARVPVFIQTNNVTGEEEFRYFLDLNRNGLFETNGFQIELDRAGRSLGFTNFHVGDPEWIGVLRRPDQPHSGSNHFVGRLGYLVLPAGKSLDLNFLHNQAKRLRADDEAFHRNQGVGSWELNLAAFLRDLNTNAWNGYDYLTNLAIPSRGIAFENALTLLRSRYRRGDNDANPTWANLSSVRQLFGVAGVRAFLGDGNDGYGDGLLQLGIGRPFTPGVGAGADVIEENDEPAESWSGAENPSQYFDPQELFQISSRRFRPTTPLIDEFTNRLVQASLGRSTYDRHTFYRLLGQLGADSVPANRGQIHLHYDNRLDFDPALAGRLPGPGVGYHATNFVRWTPTAFFTNAADQILKTLNPAPNRIIPLLSVTNIAVWPTNQYSPAVHRSLQLAANIYDATTNWSPAGFPYFPTVFRPLFGADPAVPGGLRIDGYEDITTQWENKLWATRHHDVDEDDARPQVLRYDRIAGIPAVLGAKKGFPNFNEFELQTTVVASRKLEVGKRAPNARPSFTNQLYILGISNVFGVEFWNSYDNPYPRPLELRARLEIELVLSNDTRIIRSFRGVIGYTNTFAAGEWRGGQFQLPIATNLLFLPMGGYRTATGEFFPVQTNNTLNLFESGQGFPIPVWRMAMTNRIQAALIDRSVPGGRLVDYVDLDNLNSVIDITRALSGQVNNAGQSSIVGSFWRTNRVNGIPEGIANQLQASLGFSQVSDWKSASAFGIGVDDKGAAIARFQEFLGLAGAAVPPSPTLRMQAPFTPGIKLYHRENWQANDPLVNDLAQDLWDPARTNLVQSFMPGDSTEGRSNLGLVNTRYRPWGDRGGSSSAQAGKGSTDTAIKDPWITKSQDWNFPTNAFPSLGWLGRVHRGTPWQTIYLKSLDVGRDDWVEWSGHTDWYWARGVIAPGTHPTNDWRLLGIFTTAVNENASRGLLSVNQAGLAAWSAVLSGVPVLTNAFSTNTGPLLIQPNTPELRVLVDGLNRTRGTRFGGKFNYLGEVLSTPEWTDRSPYLLGGIPTDPALERIPQMVLSLVKRDDPRMVILAFGQSLRPAPGSVVTEPGAYFQMPTNYVITGEYVTKTLMRLEGFVDSDGRPRVRPVKESYNEVPPTE